MGRIVIGWTGLGALFVELADLSELKRVQSVDA
jgi:hypothetical protein